MITFVKTGSSSSNSLPEVADYLLWYSRTTKSLKFRQLFEKMDRSGVIEHFSGYAAIELPGGKIRKLKREERKFPDTNIPKDVRLCHLVALTSQGESTTGRSGSYEYDGTQFPCPQG